MISLPEIRKLIFDGKQKEVEKLAKRFKVKKLLSKCCEPSAK